MRSYINGWYCCRGHSYELEMLNRNTNEQILTALIDSYPSGLTAHEIAERTDLPLKTVYSQLAELYREYYIVDDRDVTKIKLRGRPKSHSHQHEISKRRRRQRFYAESANSLVDIYDGKKGVPLPPGNVAYADDFLNAWHKVVERQEEEALCSSLLSFVDKTFRRMKETSDDIIKRTSPNQTIEFCCAHCGVKHEARDFLRASLLHLLDHFERSNSFIELMKTNNILTQDAYQRLLEKKLRRNAAPQILEP
jgi:predicted ArsR family transcriptional regulator